MFGHLLLLQRRCIIGHEPEVVHRCITARAKANIEYPFIDCQPRPLHLHQSKSILTTRFINRLAKSRIWLALHTHLLTTPICGAKRIMHLLSCIKSGCRLVWEGFARADRSGRPPKFVCASRQVKRMDPASITNHRDCSVAN